MNVTGSPVAGRAASLERVGFHASHAALFVRSQSYLFTIHSCLCNRPSLRSQQGAIAPRLLTGLTTGGKIDNWASLYRCRYMYICIGPRHIFQPLPRGRHRLLALSRAPAGLCQKGAAAKSELAALPQSPQSALCFPKGTKGAVTLCVERVHSYLFTLSIKLGR